MARRIPLLLAVALTGLLAAVLASAPAPATASAGPATTASSASLILGVNVHPEEDLTAAGIYDVADDTEVLNQMQAAGAQMVRLFVPWMWLEPNRPGDYDQTYEQSLDRYVQAVRARGMKLLMVLVGTPCWATSYPGADCVNGDYADGSDAGANYAPAQDTDAGTVAAYIVSRWDPDALEVWNEPDTSDYFEPPPGQDAAAAYTNLVKAIDTAVKATSPSTTIVAGALAQGDTRFLQQLYDDGIAADSDAISIHPTTSTSTAPSTTGGTPSLPSPTTRRAHSSPRYPRSIR
jgi:hypothetical protein